MHPWPRNNLKENTTSEFLPHDFMALQREGEVVLTAVLAQLMSPAIFVAGKPRPSVALQRRLPRSLCCPNVAARGT